MRLPLLIALVAGLVAPAVATADPLAGPQSAVRQASAGVAAACRRDLPVDDEQCGAVPLSAVVSDRAMEAYERSDVHRALALQYALANDTPFSRAPWLGTHNSYNTTTRTTTPSGLDPNQQLSLTDQLRLDMRSLELDAHWFPSARAGGARAPVLCHARGADEMHAGCSNEPLLAEGIAEIAAWLRGNPTQVLLLYLEDHLETPAGHEQAASDLRAGFGNLLYAPGGSGCTPLPLDATRNDVLAAGKQVLVISACSTGGGWNGAVYGDAVRARDETGPQGYGENGSCDPARNPAGYDGRFLRVFEDSTALTATTEQGSHPITAGKAAALQRCAVDLTGFDQLVAGDSRLAASVWSWAAGQPTASGDCAVQGADGRWRAGPCTARHAFACRSSSGQWSVDRAMRPYAARRGRCKGGTTATPRTGWEAAQLQRAMAAARVDAVWLSYVRTGSTWTPTDPR